MINLEALLGMSVSRPGLRQRLRLASVPVVYNGESSISPRPKLYKLVYIVTPHPRPLKVFQLQLASRMTLPIFAAEPDAENRTNIVMRID